MDDLPQSHEVLLSALVETTIKQICKERNQDPPKPEVRQMLAALGEEAAFEMVKRIKNSPGPVRNLNSLIDHRIRDAFPQLYPSGGDPGASGYSVAAFSAASGPSGAYSPSAAYPSPPAAPSAGYPSPPSAPSAAYSSPSLRAGPSAHSSSPFRDASAGGEGSSFGAGNFGSFHSSTSGDVGSSRVNRRLPFDEDEFRGRKNSGTTNNLLMILDQLEFRKLFLLLCYIGRHKLEEILKPHDAQRIAGMKDIPMSEFESRIWSDYGTQFLKAEDRQKCAQWDSGKTHLYYCDVFQDGSFSFKGPCLTTTRTHLQRSLGDQNVLIVKFIGEEIEYANIVSTEGILVGLKRYHFFVFKDESKDVKKKDRNENGTGPASKNVKCYFVNLDYISLSGMNEVRPSPVRNVAEARCLFMHIHMVSSMAKYMARFSLILSKTIRFPVDLSSVGIEIIEDIPCRDENGFIVHGEDGKQLIHTDGTSFISEDLARLCPQDFGSAKNVKDKEFQLLGHFRTSEPWSRIYFTPPLVSKKPSDYCCEEKLEAEIFRQFKKTRKPSPSMAMAADSWMSFMDKLLTEEDYRESENLKQKMLKLIDIYYDAIDSPKSGKKINVPPHLIAKDFPHYMGKGRNSYHSSSILGEMYNRIQQFESKGSEEGIWKLPFFDQCLQTRSVEPFLNLWRKRYEVYRKEMTDALRTGNKDSKNANADEVVRKYKLMLYEAEEFYESRKDSTEIYNEALAIYHVSYDHAMSRNERPKCGFAWKVAGPVLCKLLAFNQNENPILILPSVQKAIL